MKKIFLLACTALTMLACAGGAGSANKDGLLPGKFSVSDTLQVQFSQGNLQYQPATHTWRFAENQFDTIGEQNKLIADDYEGWIDLFGWGTGAAPTKTSTNNQHYPDYTEWGTNAISNGGENLPWRTLTVKEWGYLFFKRTDAKFKHGVAEVNGRDGMILLPDEWEQPEGLNFNPGFTRRGKAAYVNCYTLEQWQTMEQNGAVFLPEAGARRGTKMVSDCGDYWSSSAYNYAQAYDVFFSSIYVQTDCHGGNSYGKAVRLVR